MKKLLTLLICITTAPVTVNATQPVIVPNKCSGKLSYLLDIRKTRDNSPKKMNGRPEFPSLFVISARHQNIVLKCLNLKEYENPIDYKDIPDISFIFESI